MAKRIGLTMVFLLFAAAVTAIGQTLVTDVPAQPQSRAMPSRGMTMENVETAYGMPGSRRPPVGDPPITRWEYSDFIVYFEYKRVIHSVAKRPIS